MNDALTLTLNRVLDAPREVVFDAWLIREEWEMWLGPKGVTCDVPLHEPWVGGHYRVLMNMPRGEVIRVAGVFREIERPSRLVFTWGAEDEPGTNTLVTLTFASLGDKTELVLHQERLGTPELRDAFSEGWCSAFEKLARYVVQKAVPK